MNSSYPTAPCIFILEPRLNGQQLPRSLHQQWQIIQGIRVTQFREASAGNAPCKERKQVGKIFSRHFQRVAYTGVPIVAQWNELSCTMRMHVQPLALLSGLRIQHRHEVTDTTRIPHCCGCGIGCQLQLQFNL